MDKGLITQLQILKLSNIKPNFSELARLYDLDRRTVKRYYDGYEGKPKHHNKSAGSMSIMTLLRQSFHLEELTSERSMNISRMRFIPVLEHTQTLINMLNPKA